jgi:hypothetical protein
MDHTIVLHKKKHHIETHQHSNLLQSLLLVVLSLHPLVIKQES